MVKLTGIIRLLMMLITTSILVPSYAQTPILAEKLKAAYLIHLGEFTSWELNSQQHFTICIEKNNTLTPFLHEVSGYLIKNSPLKIIHNLENISSQHCKILYLSNQPLSNISLLSLLQDHGILTVGDHPNFIQQGGAIQFYVKNNKVRMRINLTLVKDAPLNISSKLLRLMETSSP